MSGPIRQSTKRAQSRSAHSSPYARPQPPKKSSWSFTSFLGFLNPLRSQPSVSRSPSPPTPPTPPADTSHEEENSDGKSDEDSDEEIIIPSTPAQLPPGQAKQLPKFSTQSIPGPSTLPSPSPHRTGFVQPSTSPTHDHDMRSPENDSPAKKNIDQITSFLSTKAGQTISEMEMRGVISLLRESTQPDPFRFESQSPPTPVRGNSPLPFPISTTPTSSPRKTLSRNPNGAYRWEGAGSAKSSPRARNRYASPAFGPSRATPERIVLKPSAAEAPRTDTKRRRVGEEATTSSASRSGPPAATSTSSTSVPSKNTQAFPVSSPPVTPRAVPKPTVTTTSARLRTPAVQKPTTPAIPSPLRQAWSEGSSSSQSDAGQAPPARQSKAANFMAELIKEATPPKKADVSNPYQMASPISKVTPRRPGKRARATGRPPVPTKEEREKAAAEKAEKEKQAEKEKEEQKIKQASAQAVIASTLPKGSQRAQPPAHFKKKSPEVSMIVPEVEEPEEDEAESQRPAKKTKTFINGTSGPSRPSSLTIPDIEIVDMDKKSPSPEKEKPTSPPSNGAAPPASKAVSPPSLSFFGGFKKSNNAPLFPSKLKESIYSEGSSVPPSPAPAEKTFPPAEKPIEATAKAPEPVKFPPPAPARSDYSLYTPPPSEEGMDTKEEHTTEITDPKEAARVLPISSLPTFTFVASGTAIVYLSTVEHVKVRNDVKNLPVSSLPTFTFSREAPKKALAASTIPPIKTTNWSTKAAPSPSGPSWTCSLCMLQNPPTAIEKCYICEAPRPGADSKPPPPKTFDWSGAGIKPPGASADTWTCKTCMLVNPTTADKCTVCDDPRK